jgi:hypothetical protein
MAFINRKDDNILPSKKIIFTASQLRDYLKQVEQDIKFYELEMAEVVEVHLDENKSSFPKTSEGKPNYAYMGGILARFITSEHGKAVDYLEDCKPLNPNIMTYPLVGEIVYLTQLPGTIGNKSRFYFSPFNITGSPSQNLKPTSIGEEVLYCAIRKPYETILRNAGIQEYVDPDEDGRGLDVVTGNTVDMVKAGIIDPLLVTKSALMNAASVATTILSTDCVINNVRDESGR